jgi:DNA-binding PadR family transcriptional regulator
MLESIKDAIDHVLETEQVTEQVAEQVKALILCLKKKELSTRELMQALELSHRPTFLYDYLKPALNEGYVEMTQPDSPKSPTQKYRLSQKGKMQLSLILR